MRTMSVKEYARLVGKSEKTVYKKIKSRSVNAVKERGRHLIRVDKSLLKVIERTQKALEETITLLLSIEDSSVKLKKATLSVSKPPEPKSKKKMMKSVADKAPSPLKKSPKKAEDKKTAAKNSTRKRKEKRG